MYPTQLLLPPGRDSAGARSTTVELASPSAGTRSANGRVTTASTTGIGDRFFSTLGVAVDAYLRETGVDGIDWGDRGR